MSNHGKRRFQLHLSSLVVGTLAVGVAIAFHIYPREQHGQTPLNQWSAQSYGFPLEFYRSHYFDQGSGGYTLIPLAVVLNLVCVLTPVVYTAEFIVRYKLPHTGGALMQLSRASIGFVAIVVALVIYANCGRTIIGNDRRTGILKSNSQINPFPAESVTPAVKTTRSGLSDDRLIISTVYLEAGWPISEATSVSGVCGLATGERLHLFIQDRPVGEIPILARHRESNNGEIETLVLTNVPTSQSCISIVRNGLACLFMIATSVIVLEYSMRRLRSWHVLVCAVVFVLVYVASVLVWRLT